MPLPSGSAQWVGGGVGLGQDLDLLQRDPAQVRDADVRPRRRPLVRGQVTGLARYDAVALATAAGSRTVNVEPWP